MNTPLDTSTLERIAAPVFNRTSGLKMAFLFGSRARGTHTIDSDIDIAVLGLVDILQLQIELEAIFSRPVDVLSLNRADIPTLATITPNMRPLWERTEGAVGRWLASTLSMLETDLPMYNRVADAYIQGFIEAA